MDPYQTAHIGAAQSIPTMKESTAVTLRVIIVNKQAADDSSTITLRFSFAGALKAKTPFSSKLFRLLRVYVVQ